VTRSFKNPKLAQILQFPVLFLGAKPEDTPAFYNFMNFADFGLGTWHPKDGMYSIVKGMVQLAESLGVKIHLDSPVEKILMENKKAVGIKPTITIPKRYYPKILEPTVKPIGIKKLSLPLPCSFMWD
jgi:phytoene dehydrogenase-like protein